MTLNEMLKEEMRLPHLSHTDFRPFDYPNHIGQNV